MKTLMSGVWHMLGVVSAVSYWGLSLLFLWGGLVLLGSEPAVGQATLAFVGGLFVIRLFAARKLPLRGINIAACLAFGLFALLVNIYHHQTQACGIAIHADGHQARICL